jgi:hypothetical protein
MNSFYAKCAQRAKKNLKINENFLNACGIYGVAPLPIARNGDFK